MQKKLKSVIIVAGGSGKRMKSEIPKQFLLLANKPILMYSINKFYNYNSNVEIIVVLPQNQVDYWQKLCVDFNFKTRHKVAIGGQERFFSVKNGLSFVEQKNGLIAVHDGVRPLIDFDTINRGVQMAQKFDAVVPIVSVSSSVRIVEDEKSFHFDRNKIKLVQTPQIFDVDLLKKAYQLEYNSNFTDDASVVEALGQKIELFGGDFKNIKITNKFDLAFAGFINSQT